MVQHNRRRLLRRLQRSVVLHLSAVPIVIVEDLHFDLVLRAVRATTQSQVMAADLHIAKLNRCVLTCRELFLSGSGPERRDQLDRRVVVTSQVKQVAAVKLHRETQVLVINPMTLQTTTVTSASVTGRAVANYLRYVRVVVIHPVPGTDFAMHSGTVCNVGLDQLRQYPVVDQLRPTPD